MIKLMRSSFLSSVTVGVEVLLVAVLRLGGGRRGLSLVDLLADNILFVRLVDILIGCKECE